ncbi:zinc finger protein 271-like [Malaya genurostris]|uniref:zinc finger protein 271-like n=1 Tax=Malaya genurostris TaxID=325434 RepID=UPI0026F3A511|nr:zinc finger protein 271-like [Malaya genurostris]
MNAAIESSMKPPNKKPETYCRLCFTLKNIKPLSLEENSLSQHVSWLVWKHLSIQLRPNDFPCGLCSICLEKLEELQICNNDGLLDEWEDEDLMEFKRTCRRADKEIRNQRRKINKRAISEQSKKVDSSKAKRVVLPFHQLDNGQYQCNLCPQQLFDHISDCIKHYHEIHPDSTLSKASSGNDNSAIKGKQLPKHPFVCVTCSAGFDQIDDLIKHRELHKGTKRAADQTEQSPDASLVSTVDLENPVMNGANNQTFKCSACAFSFYDIDALIEHRHTAHAVAKKKSKSAEDVIVNENNSVVDDYKCPYCEQQFTQSKAYYFHMNVVHDKNICDCCGESFQSASTLVKHQAQHRSVEFPCDLCPYSRFSTRMALESHINRKHRGNTFENVETDTFAFAGTSDSNNVGLYSELLVTCSGCFLAFRSDEELSAHYADCPAQLFLEDTSNVMMDDESKVVEISDDE